MFSVCIYSGKKRNISSNPFLCCYGQGNHPVLLRNKLSNDLWARRTESAFPMKCLCWSMTAFRDDCPCLKCTMFLSPIFPQVSKIIQFGGWKELLEFFMHILFQSLLNYRPFVGMKANQISTYHLHILWKLRISLNDPLKHWKTSFPMDEISLSLTENWFSLDLCWWHIWQYCLSKGFKRS